jgi:hypothetical protein
MLDVRLVVSLRAAGIGGFLLAARRGMRRRRW